MDHEYTTGIKSEPITLASLLKGHMEPEEESCEIIEEETEQTEEIFLKEELNGESVKPVIVQMPSSAKKIIIKGGTIENVAKGAADTSLQFAGSHKWTRESITLLISLRSQLDEYFENPKNKKLDYWEYISNILSETGFQISAHDCHTKWRNLCGTYRMNKEKLQRLGIASVRWEFFDQMDAFMKRKQMQKLEVVYNDVEDEEESDDDLEMARLLKIQSDLAEINNAKRKAGSDQASESVPAKKPRSDSPPAWFKEYISKKEAEEKSRDERFFTILEAIKESEQRKTALLESLLHYFDRN